MKLKNNFPLLICLCLFLSILPAKTLSATQAQEEPFALAFTKKPKSLKAGKHTTLKTNAPEGASVSYSVSDAKYAAITDDGILTGKRVGTVTVNAVYGEYSASCKIKITGKKIIYVDAGHQRKSNSETEPIGPGSSTRKVKEPGGATGVSTKIPEYKFNLTIAKKLKQALIKKGYDVVLSRTSHDVNMGNVDRAKKGNKSGAHICIRIHADSINQSSVTGASALYASSSNPYYIGKLSKKSKRLAELLLKKYCDATGIKNRGAVVRNDLTGTNWSRIPTVLIECGFISNAAEDRKLNDAKFQKKMIKGMVNGIDAYFGY